MGKVIAQQGEVPVTKISGIPQGVELSNDIERNSDGHAIISHSEKGHHHIVTGGNVMERTSDVPAGMKIFYAILDAPASFEQDGPNPHEKIDLDPGVYEFRVSREYNPFTEQARRVID